MIYSFNQLSKQQLGELYRFIASVATNLHFDSYDGMVENYTSIVFNSGRGFFSVWDEGQIKGTLGLITKEIDEKGDAFITGIYMNEEDKVYIRALLEHGLMYVRPFNPQRVLLGIHESRKYLMDYVTEAGFQKVYQAVVLTLSSEEKLQEIAIRDSICFEDLSEDNKAHFKEVHNEAFRSSPNGSVLEDRQVEDMLKEFYKGEALIGLCYDGDEAAGIYEMRMKGRIGWIDGIGVHPELWGKGVGKAMLAHGVDKLRKAGAGEIKLIVMSTNKAAYELYKTYGFTEEKVMSYWYERQL